MCAMIVPDLLSAWPIDGPWIVRPVVSGGNNLSYPVAAPDGHYVLRIYQNTADPERVRYEHALLTRLERIGLSFSVPAPIPTRAGATLLPVAADGEQLLAALFPLIPGQHPYDATLARWRVCGAALAELDRALGGVTIPAPRGMPLPFGQLSEIHAAVPAPLEIAGLLPLEREERAQAARIVGDLMATAPALYSSLPRQIVHRDFDASNILMEGGRVTGVLDFEFAGPDLRALDLARSLSQFTVSPWSSPEGWSWVTAFVTGYRERAALMPGEIDALPDMMRLCRAMSLVHREGRRRQGLAAEADVLARARALLMQEEWLGDRQEDLLQLLRG